MQHTADSWRRSLPGLSTQSHSRLRLTVGKNVKQAQPREQVRGASVGESGASFPRSSPGGNARNTHSSSSGTWEELPAGRMLVRNWVPKAFAGGRPRRHRLPGAACRTPWREAGIQRKLLIDAKSLGAVCQPCPLGDGGRLLETRPPRR